MTNLAGKKLSATLPANVTKFMNLSREAGVQGMITSLGLLCLVSLLLALLSLVFLLKISPASDEKSSKYQVIFGTKSPIHRTCLSLSVSMVLKIKLKYMLRTTEVLSQFEFTKNY